MRLPVVMHSVLLAAYVEVDLNKPNSKTREKERKSKKKTCRTEKLLTNNNQQLQDYFKK